MESKPLYPHEQPDQFAWIAYVVDGEVAIKMPISFSAEHMVAVCTSDPKLVPLEGDDRLGVQIGWTYDGKSFIPQTAE
jgi:hypothetical protein